MMASGTHSPAAPPAAVQAAGDSGRLDSSPAGTQWAPPQVGLHPAKAVGLNTGGPFHGHWSSIGGCVGASHPKLQAPVGAVASDAVGSKQGMHRSPASHVLCGNAT